MEKTFCKYHPSRPALWYCESCRAFYCSDCIEEREIKGGLNKKTVMYLCPSCKSVTEQLAVQNVVEPFWNRLPKFFTYPFTTPVIVLMLVVAALMSLFFVPGILSIFIQVMLFCVLLKFCFAVLKETASGKMSPPPIDERIVSGDIWIVFKYWGLGILFLVIAAACFVFSARLTMVMGPVIGLGTLFGCLIGLLLILPAAIIVLASTESLIQAINPFITIRMAFRIGPSYFLMYFFLITLYAAPGVVGYFAQPYLPRLAFAFIISLANCYYSIVAHHLMGYVILQHHDDIGYEVDVTRENMGKISGHSRSRDASHDLLNKVNILIREGKHDEAVNVIREETGGRITNLDLAERYYNLLKISRNTPELTEHAKTYLDLLVKAQKKDTARDTYLECVAADPQFNPRAAILFRVAGYLSEAGNYKASLSAYNRFIQNSPEDPMAPKAFLLAAQVFHEKLMDTEKAAKTLKRLIKSFPEHEVTPYARKYLQKIEQPA